MSSYGRSKDDWTCKSCNRVVYGSITDPRTYIKYATNKIICICGQTKWGSKQFPKDKYTWRIGDKLCGGCNQWNFKSNTTCKFCKTDL